MKSIFIKYFAIIIVVFISLALYDLTKAYVVEAESYYKLNLDRELLALREIKTIQEFCDSKANLEISDKITSNNIDDWNKVNLKCRNNSEKLTTWISLRKYHFRNQNSFKGKFGKFVNKLF